MLAHSYMWLLHKLLRVDTPTPTPLPPNSPQLAGPGWGGLFRQEGVFDLTDCSAPWVTRTHYVVCCGTAQQAMPCSNPLPSPVCLLLNPPHTQGHPCTYLSIR